MSIMLYKWLKFLMMSMVPVVSPSPSSSSSFSTSPPSSSLNCSRNFLNASSSLRRVSFSSVSLSTSGIVLTTSIAVSVSFFMTPTFPLLSTRSHNASKIPLSFRRVTISICSGAASDSIPSTISLSNSVLSLIITGCILTIPKATFAFLIRWFISRPTNESTNLTSFSNTSVISSCGLRPYAFSLRKSEFISLVFTFLTNASLLTKYFIWVNKSFRVYIKTYWSKKSTSVFLSNFI